MDGFFGAGIDRRRCVVEHQNRWVGQRGAGQCDALPLPARQRVAPFADHGVVAMRQIEDEVVCLGDARRGLDVGIAGTRAGEGDVLLDGRREQEALLEHDVDCRAQRRQREVTNVGPIEPHGPAARVVEASHQQGESGLARAGCTDEPDSLARLNGQRDAMQGGRSVCVPEADVVEFHPAFRIDDRPGVVSIRHAWLQIEEFEDPLRPGARLLGCGEHAGENAHGRDDLHHVAGERKEHPQRDVSVEGEPPADPEYAELTEHWQQLQGRRIARVQPSRAHARLVQLVRAVHQPIEFAILLGKRLHDTYARDRLVDHAGDGARQPLIVPTGWKDPISEPDRQPAEDRHEQGDHQAENWRQHEHHTQRHDHQRQVGHQHRHRKEEHLNQCEVGGAARHDVADRQFVVTREIEFVEVSMDGQAQVVLNADADFGAEIPAAVVGREAEHARRHQHDQHRAHRMLLRQDAVVHDDLLDERQQADERLGDDRQDQRGDDRAAVTTDERSEPSQPTDALARRPRSCVRSLGKRGS
jgi:hypothetical protein